MRIGRVGTNYGDFWFPKKSNCLLGRFCMEFYLLAPFFCPAMSPPVDPVMSASQRWRQSCTPYSPILLLHMFRLYTFPTLLVLLSPPKTSLENFLL